CTFGKQLRELGSTWYADLGPPFGVMYCIKCECIPIQKKRRIVARVQCRNIKNECPKLNCEEPVLLPGKCCKSCPGEYITVNRSWSKYAEMDFEYAWKTCFPTWYICRIGKSLAHDLTVQSH
ncbi:hypothetical protein KQX54_017098, partial [Cotesia glomerata]